MVRVECTGDFEFLIQQAELFRLSLLPTRVFAATVETADFS